MAAVVLAVGLAALSAAPAAPVVGERLEDVRPGNRVVVSSMESEGGRRRARLVRAGGARAALAFPPAPVRP